MITETDNQLPMFQILGPTLRINFDEQILTKTEMDDSTRQAYQYETAVLELGSSKDTIINEIIRTKYSMSAEIATINNSNADPESYVAYQNFRNQAKTMAAQYFNEPYVEPIPGSVTRRQARLALLGAGLLDQVEAGIKTMDRASQISWDTASSVNRTDPLVSALAVALNLSTAQLDQLFLTGSKL